MNDQPTEDQTHGLVRAALMYYEQNLTQEQIAKALNKSRPTVSRMLATARDLGIVHVEIRVPLDRVTAMEKALVDRFGLTDCRVMTAPKGDLDTVDHLGRAAADYVQSLLESGMVVGVSNGRTVASTAKYLQPKRSLHLEVVQIIGAMGSDDPGIDGPDIARELALTYDARCHYLHVPLLVDNVATREMLLRDRSVSQTLRLAANADVALLGVGTLNPRDQSPLLSGFLSQREVDSIRHAGGVGHICGEHYSATGHRLSIEINDRIIGIGLPALTKIPRVIAVAGGVTKAPAILAGIRGGYIETLITDHRAAARMLDMAPADFRIGTQRSRRPARSPESGQP